MTLVITENNHKRKIVIRVKHNTIFIVQGINHNGLHHDADELDGYYAEAKKHQVDYLFVQYYKIKSQDKATQEPLGKGL